MLTSPGGRWIQPSLSFIDWEWEESRWLQKEKWGASTRTENSEAVCVYQTYIDIHSWLWPVERWSWELGNGSHSGALLNAWRMFPTLAFSTHRITTPSTWVPQTCPLFCYSIFLSVVLGFGRPVSWLWLCHSSCVWLWIIFSLSGAQFLILRSRGRIWIRW